MLISAALLPVLDAATSPATTAAARSGEGVHELKHVIVSRPTAALSAVPGIGAHDFDALLARIEQKSGHG